MRIETLDGISWAWMALALLTCVVLFRVAPPFGRHASERWGPMLGTRLGWVLMELPSLLIMGVFLVRGMPWDGSYAWLLFALWIVHYVHRTLVYPLRIRPAATRMPLLIAACAIGFNVVNAGLNGATLTVLAADYDRAWLTSPHCLAGGALFGLGMAINLKADTMLIRLRADGAGGYRIPRGFLFEQVSAPNLLGEMLQWAGFALMAWNPAALSFAIWTVANLLPRAKHHHDWYHARFPDYPPQRKVVFPYLY